MLSKTQPGAPNGDQRRGGASKTPLPHGTRRFIFRRLRRDPSASWLGRLVQWCLARHVVRVDAGLCPGGRLSAESLVSLIDGGEDIKSSSISDVYRTQWAGRDVVVKRYNHVGLGHTLRHSIKGSRARHSWINGQWLLRLGIPTPRPLAYIDEYRGLLLWRSYIATEYVDGRRLSELLEDESVPRGAKRRLISQVLRLMHRLSLHGINHGDMKHTNILCLAGQVVLTDLDSVETHGWEWLHRQRRAVDMARFLRDIGNLNGQWGPPETSHPPAGDSADSREQGFARHKMAGGEIYLNREFCSEDFEETLLVGSDAIRRRYPSALIESSRNSTVVRFQVAQGRVGRSVYFKEYLRRSLWDRLKEFVRPAPALRAFRASLMLADAGFLAPTVVAAGWVHTRSSGNRSFLATEEVSGAQRLHEYLVARRRGDVACSLQDRRDLLRSVGQVIGRMHRMGIVHGDLRPGNVLARKVAERWEFFFVDNEHTRKRRFVSRRLRLKNLVQINMLPEGLTQTDRMRFFQGYMLANPSVCIAYKRWAWRIMSVTLRRFRRKGWIVQRRAKPRRDLPRTAVHSG